MDYTPFDKPHTIWSSQGESRFSYDASEKLVKRTDKKAGGDMVTYYVGGHEAIYQPDGSSEIKRYIRDIAIHTIKSSGSQSLHYVFNDHLGSGSVITDANGNVVETASFDAFGKSRDAKLWGGYTDPFSHLPNLQALLNITQKGYTGHIQVDHASIIHMVGRIYDPDIGRFIQADPIVQDPRDAQSLNRYSYVYNNPLSYTDPTGYSTECGAKPGELCSSALEQQKETNAKAAAQTQGSSKTQEVNKGNRSADLQNSAKVASGQQQDEAGKNNGFGSFAWGMLKRGVHDTLTAAHEHIVGIPADAAGDPMGLRPRNVTEAAGAAAYDDNALVINLATAFILGRQAALQKNFSEVVEATAKNIDPRILIGRQGKDEMSGSQVKRLTKDMKVNGYDANHPIEVANVDGKLIILDGHHRAQAAVRAGIKSIPVNVNQPTKQQADQLIKEAAEARARY
ncbi:RHS repeat-associated core domain-containing protein [Rheinheimera fenheensis]|uniref:RHS repeat-associated core and ParB-like nuclease domain-containing protein n=1 Tax=Rheinheimera fenheensis TaxID=3152295 RepID=UPI0032603954